VTRNEAGEVVYRVLTKEEIEAILVKAEPVRERGG
jgi:hypothetical protein